jgi:hypothetical protein
VLALCRYTRGKIGVFAAKPKAPRFMRECQQNHLQLTKHVDLPISARP